MAFVPSTADVSASFFRLRTDDLHNLPGNRMWQIPSPDFRSGSDRRLAVMRMGLPEANEQDGLWRLHLRNRSGSLETDVAQARRQNLLISFGILILLAAAVALLTLSARRARRLARQQMDFVAGVSHELRTPITVTNSAAYNLAKGVTRDPDQIQSYGRIIRKQM